MPGTRRVGTPPAFEALRQMLTGRRSLVPLKRAAEEREDLRRRPIEIENLGMVQRSALSSCARGKNDLEEIDILFCE